MRCFMRRDRIWAFEPGKRPPDLLALLVLAERLEVSVAELTNGLQAPIRRAGTLHVLDRISQQPEIKHYELAAALGLPEWYVAEIRHYLESIGAVARAPDFWRLFPESPGAC